MFVSQAAGRRSRQAFEAESVEGVWSVWGEWSECSQTCGVGVSQRNRKCSPPPLPQTPPLSHSPPNWVGYSHRNIGGPAVSPINPFYPPRYPGQPPPYRSHNPGLPLYRNVPAGGEGPPVSGQNNRSPPFYRSESPLANQDPAPGFRSNYYQGYNQPARIVRRPTNPGAERAGGGGNRRSVSTSREGLPSRR